MGIPKNFARIAGKLRSGRASIHIQPPHQRRHPKFLMSLQQILETSRALAEKHLKPKK